MKNLLVKFLASGLGVGYLPYLPGTAGSLWGVLFYYLFHFYPHLYLVFFAVGVSLMAVPVAGRAETLFGEKDCQKIVIDEVAGQLITYLFVPYTPAALVVGFLFFRFFDAMKIFPANWAQAKIPGGWGVVADDVIAGIQAGAIFFISFYWRT